MSRAALEALFAVYLAVIGLCVGSFLNVVIARLPAGENIVRPRSRCPKCGRQLRWYENIPVFSWIALRGRCSGCRQPISARYPLVELLTALLWLGCLRRFGWGWELAGALVMSTILVALTFIDLDHWILPFELTIPLIATGLLLAIPRGVPVLIDAAIGAAAGFSSFWAMEFIGRWIFKKEALGGGDKYLLAGIGSYLGWQSLLGVVFLSSLQGALIGLAMIAIYGRAGPDAAETPPEGDVPHDPQFEDDWKPGPTNIPFGPWLSVAALEVMLLGPFFGEVLPVPIDRLFGAS